jgi:hypothetical protein
MAASGVTLSHCVSVLCMQKLGMAAIVVSTVGHSPPWEDDSTRLLLSLQ